MSATEIIRELPNLSSADLRAVRQKLIEISEQDVAIASCDAAALEAAQMLDRMEAEDGGAS